MTGDATRGRERTDAHDPSASVTVAIRRALAERSPLDGRDGPWLGLGLAAGVLAVVVYLATNPYPAYGAGLYVQIAAEIVAHGYALPSAVPGYTAQGVPFAYPPLQFYALAVLLDLGADPVALVRVLPSVAVVAALVPTYLLARDYAGSRPGGAAAAVAVALNPQLLQWHISAGGVVRAFAFCYALIAIYAGYHVFEARSRRAVVVGLVAFAAALLAHPTYALFVVVSYLLLWATRDRSVAGLARGAVVGLGGLAVATPWLAWVVATHGVDAFFAASATHGGVGGGLATLLDGVSLAHLTLVGATYLLVARRDWFIAAWAVAAELLFAQPRFAFTVGAVVFAAVAVDAARRISVLDGRVGGVSGRVGGGGGFGDRSGGFADRSGGFADRSDGSGGRVGSPGDRIDDDGIPIGDSGGRLAGRVATLDRRSALAALCLVVASAAGGAYLTHEMTLATDPSTPEFLDREAVDAMAWAAAETSPDATFVVLGDAAEWFPALTDRTILIGPWGVEWRGAESYDRQLEAYESVSRCKGVGCVESTAAQFGERPDYVYLPKGQYTIRGETVASFGTLERSFERSPDWERAYENDGVVVFRASDES